MSTPLVVWRTGARHTDGGLGSIDAHCLKESAAANGHGGLMNQTKHIGKYILWKIYFTNRDQIRTLMV
jgi:hypothetical protein